MAQHPPIAVPNFSIFSGVRQVAILRLLGRLEFVYTPWIHQLIFPDGDKNVVHRHLKHLHEMGAIWRTMASIEHVDEAMGRRRQSGPPPKQPYIWGLTPEGKQLLEVVDAEPLRSSLDRLRVRDRRAPKVPRDKLAHDLTASAWCVSMIEGARRCRMLDSVYCHVEFVPDKRQRFDAVLILRFDPSKQTQTRAGWDIPWHDGTPPEADHRVVRFALEVDRGREKLSILLEKAHTYGTLTKEGVYTKLLGGPVTPVFLVPTAPRAGQIAREWQDGWPGGAGVISTPERATHPMFGALWGAYKTLKDNPAQPTTLLKGLVASEDIWQKWIANWVPGDLPEAKVP